MRSPSELWFRFRQEAGNLRLFAIPPRTVPVPQALPFPSPERVKLRLDPAYAAGLLALARRIAAGELPAFDTWIRSGRSVVWRKDYRHGRETLPVYFRRIPYLDFNQAGDHKWIWEINRHQHLVTLAQAWTIEPDPLFLQALSAQLESWMDQNPPQAGINWTSALEVAFRALSWIWIWHLAGPALAPALAARFLRMLYLHGRHLEINLSVYFSPNTHLLGEAVALDALGRLFPGVPESKRWIAAGSSHVSQALLRQIRTDGSHFEQSSYYHVYTLDMVLLHRVLAGAPAPAAEAGILSRMAEFLTALLGHDGRIPLLGDDDGGRLFHPFGPRDRFGRATLAVYHALTHSPAPAAWADGAAWSEMGVWWLDAPAPPVRAAAPVSQLFPGAGLACLAAEDVNIWVDGGPLGPGSAGHSHADSLQVLVRRGGRDLLIDPGTYTYMASPALRELFRGTAAHATIAVTGAGQAVPQGPFRWVSPPAVRIFGWETSPASDWLAAECRYGPFRHRRWVLWQKSELRLWIADAVDWDNPSGICEFTQLWPLGEKPDRIEESTIFCAGARIALEAGEKLSMQQIWRSLHYGHREPAVAAKVLWSSAPVARRTAMIDWNYDGGDATLRAEWRPDVVTLTAEGAITRQAVIKLHTEEEKSG